jgi:hypothetical protein
VKPGDVVDGRYRIIRVIGAGGMGVVYEVRHERTAQRLAMKCLHPACAADEEHVARFTREAVATTIIGSEHIVFVTDHGTTPEGGPYLVTEYLEGEDLERALRREGRLEPARAVGLVLQVCSALSAAHARGVVHRDLKPANLFLVRREGVGEWVKVLDFGVAKMCAALPESASLTRTGATLGTPFYMAPEQYGGTKHVDHRADIYSIGVILYEMLSGQRPFTATTYEELYLKVVTESPLPLRGLVPGLEAVPEQLERVVMRAIERDADARFSSVAELAEALSSFSSRPVDDLRPLPSAPGDVAIEGPAPETEPIREQPAELEAPRHVLASTLDVEFEETPPAGRGRAPAPRWGAAALVALVAVGAIAAVWSLHRSVTSSDRAASEPSSTPEVAGAAARGGEGDASPAAAVDDRDERPRGARLRDPSPAAGPGKRKTAAQSAPGRSGGSDGASADGGERAGDEFAEASRRSCEGGVARSCTDLANRYRSGLGVERDPEKAAQYYRRGCTGGHPDGCIELGRILDAGGDQTEAVALFESACSSGFYRGCYYLGKAHESGRGTALDPSRAREIYRRTCERGHQLSCSALERLSSEPAEAPDSQP